MLSMNYLAALGIIDWRLRARAQDVYVYTLMQAQQTVALFVFDALLKNETESALVRAMLDATKRPYQGGFQAAWSPASDFPPIVMAFGAEAAKLCQASTSLVVTHAPATLLAEPHLKQET